MPSHASSGYCALRAPTVFSVRIKSASVQKTRLWIKARAVRGGFYTRSSIVHGCAFHPCAIDDPRGRFLVRATSQLCNKGDAIVVATYRSFLAPEAVGNHHFDQTRAAGLQRLAQRRHNALGIGDALRRYAQ